MATEGLGASVTTSVYTVLPQRTPVDSCTPLPAATEDISVQTLMTALCTSSYFHHVSVGYINSLKERVCCGLWYAKLLSICHNAQYRMPYHTNMSVCHSAKHWQISITAANIITMKMNVHTETFSLLTMCSGQQNTEHAEQVFHP